MIRIDATPDIKFNAEKARAKLRPYLEAAIEVAADELLADMKRLVHTATYGGAPGKPEWRNELDHDLKRLWVQMGKDAIEAAVGADLGYGEGSYSYVRAMLIAYGSGSRAHGAPGWSKHAAIHAGPHGRTVWDDDLSDMKISDSSYRKMPTEFNQYGNDFPERAME